MKKSKLTIYFTIYMYICVIFATYTYYKISKDYFTTTKSTATNNDTVIKCNNDSLNLIIDSLNVIINTKSPLVGGTIGLKFVNHCDMIPIEESMVMDNNLEFNKYKSQYNSILKSKFKPEHLKYIKEILISKCETFADESGENIVGECTTTNNCSYIIYAAYGADEHTIIHEVCHSIHLINEELFNSKYKDKWLKINKYVSDYAETDIYEDFAETGAYYLANNIESNNPKFKLFKQFYDETAN